MVFQKYPFFRDKWEGKKQNGNGTLPFHFMHVAGDGYPELFPLAAPTPSRLTYVILIELSAFNSSLSLYIVFSFS
jgi:hypothetical protein